MTGLSGLCSGYKTTGSGLQMGLSGNIIEIGFGQYWANLYDWDVSGAIVSYLFTGASGAIPVEKTVVTTFNVSGNVYTASGIWPASGANVNASVNAGSGLFVTVPISSISGVIIAISQAAVSGIFSGNFVVCGSVLSGVFSGQQVTLTSGQSYTASGINVTVPIASISGVNVTAIANVPSGSLYLASGSIFNFTFASGVIGGGSGNLPSAWGGSGAVTVGQNLDKSGYNLTSGGSFIASGIFATVPIPSISGVVPNIISGTVYLASGSVPATPPASGSVYLASGSALFYSGYYYLASGSVTATANSGLFVTVPINTISGVVANSGLFVNATATVTSGQVWLASGSQVLIQSGQLSGQQVNLLSGNQVQVWSGTQVNTFSGFTYPASGITVTVPISSISGNNVVSRPASGSLSGQQVTVLNNLDKTGYGVTSIGSGILSGQQVTLTSGQSYTASGIWPASGAFVAGATIVSGQVFIASGTQVLVYSGQLSGQVQTSVASGTLYLASGNFVLIYSGQLSGYTVNATAVIGSGAAVVLTPGSIFANTFASGVLEQVIPKDILTYDYSGTPSTPVHTLINATRKLICRWDTNSASGYLTVYLENATSGAYQQTIGVAASGANPIVSLGDS